MTLLVGEVCAGISAASLAWKPLGWRPAWFAETDPFASRVLAHHHPAVPNHGDFTTLRDVVAAGLKRGASRDDKARAWRVACVDVLMGGTPCQDFSVAGLRASLAGERGNLTLEFIRLADAIDDFRRAAGAAPLVIAWENVPGVLSTPDNAFGAFLGGLVGGDAALARPAREGWQYAGVVDGPGRCAAWRVLDAQHFGLAQRRQRVFVLARGGLGRWAAPQALLPVVESVSWHPAPRRGQGQRVTGTLSARAEGGGGLGTDFEIGGGSSSTVAAAYGGGNGHALDVATTCTAKGGTGRGDFESETFVTHALKGEGHDGSEDGTGRGVPLVPMLAATLKASTGGVSGKDAPHVVAFNARQDPDVSGAISGPLDTDPGTQAIAFAENSRAEVRLEGGDGQTTGSLKTGGGKPGQSYPVAMQAMNVRRLTPTECERLMGVPDGYTRIPDRTFSKRPKGAHFRRHRYLYEKIPAPTCDPPRERRSKSQGQGTTWIRFAADGPRYKVLGNSIAVPCLAHIGQNLARALGLETGKPTP